MHSQSFHPNFFNLWCVDVHCQGILCYCNCSLHHKSLVVNISCAPKESNSWEPHGCKCVLSFCRMAEYSTSQSKAIAAQLAKYYHVRCYAHMLNLASQQTLDLTTLWRLPGESGELARFSYRSTIAKKLLGPLCQNLISKSIYHRIGIKKHCGARNV